MRRSIFAYIIALSVAYLSLGNVYANDDKGSIIESLLAAEMGNDCRATYSVEGQTLAIPCVEVSGESASYAVQMQQVTDSDPLAFSMIQVEENATRSDGSCQASYTVETGKLDLPCVDVVNLSGDIESRDMVLWAQNGDFVFVVGDALPIERIIRTQIRTGIPSSRTACHLYEDNVRYGIYKEYYKDLLQTTYEFYEGSLDITEASNKFTKDLLGVVNELVLINGSVDAVLNQATKKDVVLSIFGATSVYLGSQKVNPIITEIIDGASVTATGAVALPVHAANKIAGIFTDVASIIATVYFEKEMRNVAVAMQVINAYLYTCLNKDKMVQELGIGSKADDAFTGCSHNDLMVCVAEKYAKNTYNGSSIDGKKVSHMVTSTLVSVRNNTQRLVQREPVIMHSWGGNGSIVSRDVSVRNPDNPVYGMDTDISRAHKSLPYKPVVFFQWRRNKETEHLSIQFAKTSLEYSDELGKASISYGKWNSSSEEKRTYKNVTLPFVLEPSKTGWFVIAVSFEKGPKSVDKITIRARTTSSSGSTAKSEPFKGLIIEDNHSWTGNGSIVSYTSNGRKADNKKTVGITYDIARAEKLNPSEFGSGNPVVFFQWEIDEKDGKKLAIWSEKDCIKKADVTYGSWGTRAKDKTFPNVNLFSSKYRGLKENLPYLPGDFQGFIIDPAKDGKSTKNGQWYVVKVAPFAVICDGYIWAGAVK